MRTQWMIAALAAGALAQLAAAQTAPRDATSPAGSGGSSNPALVGAVPEGPPPRLPDGTPDFSGVWVGAGPIGDIGTGLLPGEEIKHGSIRFRTLGCFPLTGAIRSEAATLQEVIAELEIATVSERQGRAIDRDQSGSMEKKKREGYF